MVQTIEIRDYASGDGVICHRLRKSTFLDVFSETLTYEEARAGAYSYNAVEFSERISSMETYIATTGGAIVGFCTMRIDSPVRAEVLYLYIDSKYQRAGIGTHLVQHSEEMVKRTHPLISTLYLDTAVPDYNQRFWVRMGYGYDGPSTCIYPNGKIPAIRLKKNVMSPDGQ